MAFKGAFSVSALCILVAYVNAVNIQFYMAAGCVAANLQGACNGQAAATCCDMAGAGFISDSARFSNLNAPIAGALFTDPAGGNNCAGTADDTHAGDAPFCIDATNAWAGISGASWFMITLPKPQHDGCVLPNVAYIGEQAFRIFEDGVPLNVSRHLVSLVNARIPYERLPPYLLDYKLKPPVKSNEDL